MPLPGSFRPTRKKQAIDQYTWGRRALRFAGISVEEHEVGAGRMGSGCAAEMLLLLIVARQCGSNKRKWLQARDLGIPWQRKRWTSLTDLQREYNDAVRALELHSCDEDAALSRSSARNLLPGSCADQDAAAAAIAAASSEPQYHQAASQLQLQTRSAAAPSSSQQRCNSEKLATATGEDAAPPTGLGSDAVSDCSRGPTARTPANSGSSRIEKLSLDAEPLSLDDAPRQSAAEVPHHNRHDILLRVEVRYFAGTSTEVLGTVEGVDRGEESQELLYRVRFSDGDLIHYTSEQLNGLLADGFAKILELEDTESPSGIKKIRKQ